MGGFEHPADPELYIRWVQFGMMSPVALVFGMDHPGYKEPWNYGGEALRNFKMYDSLRYQLLPYIYTSAYQQYATGAPLMRALVLDYQNDENVYEIGDQYLFGNDIMVCPVTTKGAQTRSVYLPDGQWFDWWSGKKYEGRQYIHVVTPLDTMPMFVKAGAIVPLQLAMNFVGEKKVEELTLRVFPGSNGSFDLYEDDGNSLAYQSGQSAFTRFTTEVKGKTQTIFIAKPVGSFQPLLRRYQILIPVETFPKRITENGKELSTDRHWRYDANTKTLSIKTDNNSLTPIQISIQY
jgi:alpha-glucosidase (family GH31 glycosyl hydrolase)